MELSAGLTWWLWMGNKQAAAGPVPLFFCCFVRNADEAHCHMRRGMHSVSHLTADPLLVCSTHRPTAVAACSVNCRSANPSDCLNVCPPTCHAPLHAPAHPQGKPSPFGDTRFEDLAPVLQVSGLPQHGGAPSGRDSMHTTHATPPMLQPLHPAAGVIPGCPS